jgi:hypothetical protein
VKRGIAGVAETVAAARRGTRICLVERHCELGGLATPGGVSLRLGNWLGLFMNRKGGSHGISPTGTTWTELYSRKNEDAPFPTWHVSIDAIGADNNALRPASAISDYSAAFRSTDISHDPETNAIHFRMGPHVVRSREKGTLPVPLGE